ncbi:gas vesicle protein [Streptomyces sp. NPDC003023]|uniref:gas vesicle protein GvpO n=1 Tax=Streptomyces sp. NPDC003023 TaxID=3364675 RepID=UPI0036CF92C5
MERTSENAHIEENDADDEKNEKRSPAPDRGNRPLRSVEVLRTTRAQLAELTGMDAETVSSFARTDDGWRLVVEVLELARVPDTSSLLASYEVEVDTDGELTSYRRTRRYERGRADRPSS